MKPAAPVRPFRLPVLFVLAVATMLSAPCVDAAAAGPNATVTFRKIFKSSYPEYVEIKVSDSGTGTSDIRQLDEPSDPRAMRLDASVARTIFELAAKLHNFDGVDLEMHRRIANLGEKTFSYERDGESHQVTFNYTLNHDAMQLLAIFEGLSRQQTDLADLERTMRYDPLGVNDVLIQVQKDLDNKQIPDPPQFLALLDRVAADTHYIEIARDRARTLAARIRAGGN